MKEKANIKFFDTSTLVETENIRALCKVDYVQQELKKRLANEDINVASVTINDTGKYVNKLQGLLMRMLSSSFSMDGLPAYCEIRLTHSTGKHAENIIVWSPLAWNDRFIGTAGGGYGTGGDNYITKPSNTTRGQTLPFAVCNGFTAATTDGGGSKSNWAINKDTGELQEELIENWRVRSTHFMTIVGKAVAEILHGRKVLYSYLHGGSGGGRQSMAEAQEFPEDYNGIWASCPAINWTRFVLAGHWPIAVMNNQKHILSHKKMTFFMEAAQNSVGGKEAYYQYESIIEFDPFSVVGQKCKGGIITEADAKVMKMIWDGPMRENRERLWRFFRPGVQCWNVVIPIGAFYYPLFGKKPRPFFLCTHYARWVTQNPKQTFENITVEEFIELFDKSVAKFPTAGIDNPDLTPFKNAGGKLIIDHGIDDPIIPVDGTIDYYNRVCESMGSKEDVNTFCKLYITPGDGHGNCSHHGPGITESDGMKALINWVENGKTPEALRKVQVNKKGETLAEGLQLPL